MDDQTHWQHLVDMHGLSDSRPDAVSSRKRKHSDGTEFLDWTPDNMRSPSSKRSRLEMSAISPQLLSEPTSAACHVDELDCVTDLDLDETLLDGCITEVEESPLLETTDTCSADDCLFSELLRSPSPSCMSVGEFSGHSSDTAVDSVFDEAAPTPTAKPPSDALDHGVVRAARQSHAVVKPPIRIRLRVNPPPKRPPGPKSFCG